MKKLDISNLVITSIKDIYSLKLKKHTEASARLDNSVIVIRQSGCSVYKINKKELVLNADNALFLPAGTEYELDVEKFGICTVIEFDTANEKDELEACEFFIDGDKDVSKAAINLAYFWSLKGPAYASKCMSGLYDLITKLSGAASYNSSLAGKYGMIHKSVKYIETNYADPDLYTPYLAELSDMGETYYRNIFTAVFNTPPTKYIQQYRVDKAKALLVNSDLSVEDVAVKVGFANASYFCKVFKTVTGMTPSEYSEKGRQLG